MSRGRTAGRCRHDGKTIFRTYNGAASAGRRLAEPGTAYWCPHAGGYHVRRGEQADYDRKQAEGRSNGKGAA